MAFSDFQVAGDFAKKHPGYEALLNVVEDALIERRAMQRWPGVRANLDAMFAQIRDRVSTLITQRGPFDRFCTAIYLKLSHHNDLMGLDAELVGYGDLLDPFKAIQGTPEAADMAEALLDRWLKQPPQKAKVSNKAGGNSGSSQSQPSQSNPAQSQASDQGSLSTCGSTYRNSSASPTSAEDASDQIENDQAPGTDTDMSNAEHDDNVPDTSSSKSRKIRQRKSVPENPAKPAEPTVAEQGISSSGGTLISQAIADAIAECVAHTSNLTEYRAFTKQHDRIAAVPVADESAVKVLLSTGVDVVRRLRRGLANALRSAEKRWWRDDQMRGSLSPRSLYRLCTERTQLDVFRVRSMVQGRSTAVCVVLDASGSMTQSKMTVARQAMRALLEALADLKIATEAFTFTTGDMFSLAEACQMTGLSHSDLQNRFSRFGNLNIGLIKRYEEPVKVALRRLPTIRGTGLTPLGEAMQIGAMRISDRLESRKILVVLTDGKAGCECGDSAAVIHATRVAERCRKAGIELIGVGILDDSLRAIVADAIVIHRLEDLPAQLCKLLGHTLQKGVCHVG